MFNYPHTENFPPWPIKTLCKSFISARTPEQFATAPYPAFNMLYNSTGLAKTLRLWNFTVNPIDGKLII